MSPKKLALGAVVLVGGWLLYRKLRGGSGRVTLPTSGDRLLIDGQPFANLGFGYNSAELSPAGLEILANVLATMQARPNMRVTIVGHTDNTGSDAYNLNLSEIRAQAVMYYLIDNGIEGHRVSVQAEGESNPIAPNDTEEGRALNRRVEFVIG